MNKTLRIFAKDTRHLWPEILLSLVLTAGFAATDHYGWSRLASADMRWALLIRTCMQLLMPLSWVLLTVRVVQDESLVGDRQFWLTRPYGWQRVLSAKVLFLATFICVPLVLAETFLLHQAGLHPTLVVPGLLVRFLFFSGFILIPLVSFSAITPTVTRMFVVLLGAVGYIVLGAYLLFALLPHPDVAPGKDAQVGWLSLLIPIAGVIIILLQYMRRSTRASIVILITTVLVLTVGVEIARHMATSARGYVALTAGEAAPVSASLSPDPRYRTANTEVDGSTTTFPDVPATIPLAIAAVAPGNAFTIDGVHLTYEANGTTGDLPWGAGDERFYTADAPGVHQVFLTKESYTKLAQHPAILHVTLAVTEYEPEAPQKVWFDGKTMDPPDDGHCILDPGTTDLQCQYALARPGATAVSWHQQENCGIRGPLDTDRARWTGRYEGMGFQPALSPVEHLVPVNFNRLTMASLAPVCPATWFTFTKYHAARRLLVEVTLPPFDVSVYRFPHMTIPSDSK